MTASKDELDRAYEIVYEELTGNCWHSDHMGEWFFSDRICLKCGQECLSNPNPPLATSLDAWAEHIFSVMSIKQQNNHDYELTDMRKWQWSWQATPLHHLEAALRMLGKWDEWREQS